MEPEEDEDTIAKHVAKQFAKGHTTEQTNLRISVKVEEQGVDGLYLLAEDYTKEITLPVDMRDSFLSRMEHYLTT